jgi:hypothetical protein
MEVRADFAERGIEVDDDELGAMNITFSVEAESHQMVSHLHVFSRAKAPLAICPVVFDPPALERTWIVRVQLTPVETEIPVSSL